MATFNGREWTVADMLPFKYVENWDDFFDDVIAEMSARTAAVGSSLSSTSATSLPIGTGSKSLTVAPNKAFAVGQPVVIAATADVTKSMYGSVTSYNATTGALEASISEAAGSGTYAAWTVSLVGPKGATGGATLPAGSVSAPGLAVTGDSNTGLAQIGGPDTLSMVGGGKELTRATLNGLVVNPGRSIAQPELLLQGPNASEDYSAKRNGTTGYLTWNGVQAGYSGYSFRVNDGTERLLIPNAGPVTVDGIPIGAGLYTGTPSKSANYTVTSSDGGGVIRCTAGLTITLLAASSLSSGWWVTVSNRSAGIVTILPAGSDTINGLAGFTLRAGQDITLYRSSAAAFDLLALGQSVSDSSATWSPTAKSAGFTLSNSNLTATGTGGSVRATIGASSGKRYFETTLPSAAGAMVGLIPSTGDVNATLGTAGNGLAYLYDGRRLVNGSQSSYGSSLSNGVTVRVAVDFDAGKAFIGVGSVWQGGADPVSGAAPFATGLTGLLYPAFGQADTGTPSAIGLFSPTAFIYGPPAGYTTFY